MGTEFLFGQMTWWAVCTAVETGFIYAPDLYAQTGLKWSILCSVCFSTVSHSVTGRKFHVEIISEFGVSEGREEST